MHMPGIWGLLVVAVVVVLLFGRGKISGLMGEVASGIKAFQKGIGDDEPAKRLTRSDESGGPAGAEARKDLSL